MSLLREHRGTVESSPRSRLMRTCRRSARNDAMTWSGHLQKGRAHPRKWPPRLIPSAELLITIHCKQPYQTQPLLSRARIQGMDPEALLSTIASFLRYSRMGPSRYEDHFQNTFVSRVGPVARSLGNGYVPAGSG